jgi:hypothetical protein
MGFPEESDQLSVASDQKHNPWNLVTGPWSLIARRRNRTNDLPGHIPDAG